MIMEDDITVTELRLWIDNDYGSYSSALLPVYKNLYRHYRKGRFDYGLAVRGMGYAVTYGAKRYHVINGRPGDRWFDMFPKSVRDKVAVMLVDNFCEMLRCEDDLEFLGSL